MIAFRIFVSFVLTAINFAHGSAPILSNEFDSEVMELPPTINGQVGENICPKLDTKGRLPKDAVPINYQLTLWLQLNALIYYGEVTITIGILEETDRIILHGVDFNIIRSHFLYNDTLAELKTKYNFYDESTQMIHFHFAQRLQKGKGKLKISFTGLYNDKLKGLYKSNYKTPDGKEHHLISTQFEPSDARLMFPCFDEPDLKATFDVKIVAKNRLTILSNMPEIKRDLVPTDPTLAEVTFQRTPLMSTYLLAIVVGELGKVEGLTKSKKIVRVFTPLQIEQQGNFALNMSIQYLNFYDDFFGISYPLPKVDHISVADFAMGAMENWGLITYRQHNLLVNNESPADSKLFTAMIVAHELAHQWFGNLVTMYWWDNIWLNEGFAEFMQYYTVKNIYPHLNMWEYYVRNQFGILLTDSLQSSHPIVTPIQDPLRVRDTFDEITYLKGSITIRMLWNFVGDKQFREGLRKYMDKHKYGNTCANNLWQALGGKKVKDFMTPWLEQKGFPLISICEESRTDSMVRFKIDQVKFEASGKLLNKTALWQVSLDYVTSSGDRPESHDLLKERLAILEVILKSPGDWVLFNPGRVGYFRINYCDSMIEQLKTPVRTKKMKNIDRAHFQNDVAHNAKAGYVSIIKWFELLDAYQDEDDYYVWKSLMDSFGYIEGGLSNYIEFRPLLDKFALKFLANIQKKISWQIKADESVEELLMRIMIFTRLGIAQQPDIVREAREIFHEFKNTKKPIHSSIRKLVFMIVGANANDEEYDFMLEKFEHKGEDQNRYRAGLTITTNEKHIEKYLELVLSPLVRSQDTVSVLVSLACTKEGRLAAWNFFKENKDTFYERYANSKAAGDLIFGLVSGFSTEEMYQEVKEFMNELKFPGSELKLTHALELIKLQKNWITRNKDILKEYLTKQVTEDPNDSIDDDPKVYRAKELKRPQRQRKIEEDSLSNESEEQDP